MRNKTIVIGSGRLGASIATYYAENGHLVDLIDKDETSFRKLSEDFKGNIIFGDATEMEVLEVCRMHTVARLVVVTGNDNVNTYIALLAHKYFDIPKIYMRLFDVSKGKLVEEMPIQVIYPFNLSIDAFIKLESGDET